jgi:methylenetetrahydrofolate reductase (NADPH)
VEPSRPCIWHHIYERADKTGQLERLLEVQAPLDWKRVGHETWGTVISKSRERKILSPKNVFRRSDWLEEVDEMFAHIRQPEWWQGDDAYHPPANVDPVSRLQAALNRGEFVITAEVKPPIGSNVTRIEEQAENLFGLVHAANVTQNPMATPRMSSFASCLSLIREGIEPVLQLTARDYNRLALQSEVLGAAALGIHNVLSLSGDPPTAGRNPAGQLPYDLDATQMLWILRRMRDKGIFLDGREIDKPPDLFLGAAGSPGDPNLIHEALRLEKKINAGAQFIQTQLIYDIDSLTRWLEALNKRNLIAQVHILVGIGPLRSVKTARYMQENIPDIKVPLSLVEKMEKSQNPQETGLEITIELIQEVRNLPGVSGIHVMALGWEKVLSRLLSKVAMTVPGSQVIQ